MAAKSQDKILFGAGLVLLLASAGWMAMQNAQLSAIRESSSEGVPQSAYEAKGIDAPTVKTQTWPPPPAQPSGPKWVYDVFTSPEIYYDADTRQFTVTPIVAPPPPPPPPPPSPFGLHLIQVKQDAFRLQLVGYVGSAGDYRGNFENAITGNTVIGRAGKVFPDLGLSVKSFEVKHSRIESKDNTPIYDTEAIAVVVDTKTGEEVTLTNKRRLIKGEPIAVLSTDGTTPLAEHKAGSTVKVGDSTYTVLNVVFSPPSVELRKESPELKEPETKTLTPYSPPAPVPVSPTPPAPTNTPFPFGN